MTSLVFCPRFFPTNPWTWFTGQQVGHQFGNLRGGSIRKAERRPIRSRWLYACLRWSQVAENYSNARNDEIRAGKDIHGRKSIKVVADYLYLALLCYDHLYSWIAPHRCHSALSLVHSPSRSLEMSNDLQWLLLRVCPTRSEFNVVLMLLS